jgi:hypothetical protein
MYGQGDGGLGYGGGFNSGYGSSYRPQGYKAYDTSVASSSMHAQSNANAAAAPGKKSIEQLLSEYLAELQKPINVNDPYIKQYLMASQNRAADRARLSGIEGGLSNLNTEHAHANALGQLEMQRKGMYPAALQMGINRDQYNQGRYMEDMLRQYQAQVGQAQGIGGLLGGIGGGALGFAVGGPAGMTAGAGMGAQIGGGLGGMTAGPPPSAYGYRGGY